jgi:dihydrolipoamide dehydrogenase
MLADDPLFDFSAMSRHKDQIVKTSVLGVQKSLKEIGVQLIPGQGHLITPSEVEVISADNNRASLKSKRIVIAWGSEPAGIPGILFSKRILNSSDFLNLDHLPKSVVIVGAGSIGVEFATFLIELGCRVTLIEALDQILPLEDSEAVQFLTSELKKRGVEIYTSTSLHSVSEDDDKVRVRVSNQGCITEMDAQYAIICTGRKPFFLEDDLARLNIVYNRKGIIIDGDLMTNIPGVYAVGDVTGGILLAHRAARQGKMLASRLFGDGSVPYMPAAIPSVTYSHPNIARVGLTEKEAENGNLPVNIIRSEYGANILARSELAGSGFAKFLFHNDLFVGATIIGEQAAELISPLALAIANSMHKADLKRWVIPHPTLSELLAI